MGSEALRPATTFIPNRRYNDPPELTPLDRGNVEVLLAGVDFTGDLLRLIRRADSRERLRLALAYPNHVWAIQQYEDGRANAPAKI